MFSARPAACPALNAVVLACRVGGWDHQAAGFLMMKELEYFSKALESPERPYGNFDVISGPSLAHL